MIRIFLNVKAQGTKKTGFSPKGPTTPKLRCETLYIGNYEYMNISSLAVLDILLKVYRPKWPSN